MPLRTCAGHTDHSRQHPHLRSFPKKSLTPAANPLIFLGPDPRPTVGQRGHPAPPQSPHRHPENPRHMLGHIDPQPWCVLPRIARRIR